MSDELDESRILGVPQNRGTRADGSGSPRHVWRRSGDDISVRPAPTPKDGVWEFIKTYWPYAVLFGVGFALGLQ